MIRPTEIAPLPKDGITTQIAQMHRMARSSVMGAAGPGLLHSQTHIGMTVQVDPMTALKQGFGKGTGRSGPARWG
jgi:hypothetical protein